MFKRLKKALLTPVCIIALIIPQAAGAYNYPKALWAVNSKYEAALSSGNHYDLINYGSQILEIMKGAPEGKEKQEIMVSRYNQVAMSYAALGDYENSGRVFSEFQNYADSCGGTYWEYSKGAKARALQYTPRITMYTDAAAPTYYGAKNEKQNGVLYGTCNTQSITPNESLILTYQELGRSLIASNLNVLQTAKQRGCAVEFALNCPNEGGDMRNIRNLTSYLSELSDAFANYNSVPVYLRFAAEFDVWTNQATPDEFKDAYRYVSQFFKSRNANVAMVWSPNHVSGWYINADDFYPGDEYVDWVGVSLYAQPHFLADPAHVADNDILFKAGDGSDPVLAIKDLVEKYGNRKPIIISECGTSHRVLPSGENTTDFALKRIKEYYSYLPMVYPQVKAIAYFDAFINGESNDYSLSGSPVKNNVYQLYTKGGRFIQGSFNNNVDLCYRPVENGTIVNTVFPVSCYAHRFGTDAASVTYSIDGNFIGMSGEAPFTVYADASAYVGTHTLSAAVTFANGQTLNTSAQINISAPSDDVSVNISDEAVSFDRTPVIYNGRTMVPMRKIFEQLGADVDWDSSTKTVTGTRGDRKVQMTIGSRLMYVNGSQIILDTAPFILSDRTLVPVRAVAEGLGCDVSWNGDKRLVEITQ